METENTPVATEEVVVESTPIETVAEPTSVEVAESEAPKVGRDAVEHAFDKLAGEKEIAAEDKEAEEEPKPEEETKEEPVSEAKAEEPASADKPKGLDPSGRGPNSWKPQVREKFKGLPGDVQGEILRRENEHQKLMTETTNLRRFGEEFQTAYAPYEAYLRSSNVHPIAAFKDLLNTAYTLKTGDQSTKAQMVAAIIQNNGIDIQTLDRVLSGQQEQVDPHTAAIQRELNEMRQWREAQERSVQQSTQQSVDQQIHEFANDPANEFFQDVVGDMQMLLNSGRAQTLKDAYDLACRINPDVAAVMQTRSAPVAQPVQQPVTPQVTQQQKVAASSSVKGAPSSNRAPTAAKQKLEGRDAALAAWERLERTTRT